MDPGVVSSEERESGELPIFRGVANVVELVERLCRRPRFGDDPGFGDAADALARRDRRTKRGLPLVCLIRPPRTDGLLGGLARRLDTARPNRVPHCHLLLPGDAPDNGETTEPRRKSSRLTGDDVRQVREILAHAADRLGSSRNAHGGRIRFRRFGLLDWLMSQDLTDVDRARRESELRTRLRQRDIVQWFHDAITSVGNDIPVAGWWKPVVALVRLVPPLLFMVKVTGRVPLFGPQYRWFLRQPHLAPKVPGGFLGFAERLTDGTDGWRQEDPDQLARLLTNAFLEDLRRAWRFPWRATGPRRMTYAVLLLDDVTADNGGHTLLQLINDVRNETGRFDPLLLISAGRTPPVHTRDPARSYRASNAESACIAWQHSLSDARRARSQTAWYLVLSVPDEIGDDDRDDIHQHVAGLLRYRFERPPWWARRIVPLAAVVVILAGALTAYATWSYQQCGGGWRWPSPGSTVTWVAGQCIGVTDGDHTFDPALAAVTHLIRQQNQQSEQAYRQNPSRPYVTLVDLQALTSPPGEPDGLAAERESLEGAAVAQAQAINDPIAPLIRLLIGNAGTDMAYGTTVARQLPTLPATDAPLVGVIGLDRSTQATKDTVAALAIDGLPTMASTLSEDQLADANPMYYQVSPQNRREAAVAAAFATTLRTAGKIDTTVTVYHPDDPNDTYAQNLTQDALASFSRSGFQVRDILYAPTAAAPATVRPGILYPTQNGKNTCGSHGLVYYAGDGVPDFNAFLDGMKDCPTPPALLADDDVTRYVADTNAREQNQSVPYWYTSFATAPTTTPQGPASNFYDGPAGLYALFPAEHNHNQDPSLDGHAAMTFDAIKTMTEAVKHLRLGNQPLPLTPGHLWREITSIRGTTPSTQSPNPNNNDSVQGITGLIDFGASGSHRPANKQISILQVQHGDVQQQPAYFCGSFTGVPQNPGCPVDQ